MSPFGIIKRSLVMAPHGGISMESRVEETLKESLPKRTPEERLGKPHVQREGARQKLASAPVSTFALPGREAGPNTP